jgi:hypothetical protein
MQFIYNICVPVATMRSLLPPRFHYYIYVFALLMLAVGLPLSKYLMSLSQLILLGNWVLEGNLKEKFIAFWQNKPAFVLSSLLLLHFAGLLYTSDMNYAINDIRIKLPLLALPLIISTSRPLPGKIFDALMYVVIAATFTATITSNLILMNIIHKDIVDTRNISIFIDHIRFGLLICVVVFIASYYAWRSTSKLRIMWIAVIVWFLLSLVLMESLTGIAVLGFTFLLLVFYQVLRVSNFLLKFGGISLILISVAACFFFLRSIYNENILKDHYEVSKLEWRTKHGNTYGFDVNNPQTENGHYIWMYYCVEEMEQAWDKRSPIPFVGKDKKGNDIRFTLQRFLTSKGWRKDMESVNALTDEEVKAIEHGIPNVNYQNVSSLKGRLHETMWEIEKYRATGDPNGQSLIQRFEYWKTALHVIAGNPIIGVGTGDVQQAFDEQYEKDQSPLAKDIRFHSHNQYLTITVAFGLLGLGWFLFTLFYPMISLKKSRDFLYSTFFIVALISFLNEDTLETQAGVTFYVFFNTVFLFMNRQEESSPVFEPSRALLFNRYG